ncbi:hypothetical protein Deipr_1642 [Deinococcus proteolyticus MRP]|uniref:Uncharacterized protein n=1 Tax=Deinococcus proteolyticus (strain ATCC 35074 / DSM 20540 / JCM 6276 / NBRC 101906 / NCIMB 13154 / VKM Ac-1939 / CCM 2703 / MRP) TaxID=693977 RepID=F0RKR8_DEIPM|nr:hypothetical protein [Deinococcus proteolyticus]ADY26780.1 hypothetical protein Deipr_1642 [Deinococcus proteolyticus MRP]
MPHPRIPSPRQVFQPARAAGQWETVAEYQLPTPSSPGASFAEVTSVPNEVSHGSNSSAVLGQGEPTTAAT